MHRLRCLRRVAAVLLMSIGSCWVVAAEAHAQGAPASNPRVRAEGRVSPPAAAPAARPRTEETPASTKANEKAARDAFERGRVFYDAGQFEQASLAFEEAYKLSGRDALLYNLYLAYRDASAQEKAAEALRGYLAKVPNIENRAQLEARLATPPETATPAPALPPPTESRTDEPAPRSLRFYAGISLAAVGAAAMLTSIATGVLAKHRQQELEDKCDGRICDASLEDTAASGKRLAHTTDALLFGGIALAGAGAALLVFGGLERPKTQAAQRPHFSAACSFDGCVARSTLRF
jgi:tetratricopeptide (TPR) repeat protein